MSATFAAMKRSYDAYNKLDGTELYESLGWDDVVGFASWENTCAVRMHLALMDSNEHVPGRFEVLKGKHKGKHIEVSQNALARKIESSGRFGRALRLSNDEFHQDRGQLWMKTGIVSFQRMPRYPGGHIDLLDSMGAWRCARDCYFTSSEIWFWALA